MPKQKPVTDIARLIGSSIVIKDEHGEEIVVPSNPDENKMANMLLASKMRNVIMVSIKEYKNRGATLTPKELKDLADAARVVSEFSGTVYSGGVTMPHDESRAGPKPVHDPMVVDFKNLAEDKK